MRERGKGRLPWRCRAARAAQRRAVRGWASAHLKEGVAGAWPWPWASSMRGLRAVPALLLEADAAWRRWPGRTGPLGEGRRPWAGSSAPPGSEMLAAILAQPHSAAASRPGLPGARISPPPVMGAQGRPAVSVTHARPWPYGPPRGLTPGGLASSGHLLLKGIWKLNSQQTGKRFHMPLWLAGARRDRRRRCDRKAKAAVWAHLARAFYFLHHLHFAAVISEAEPPRTCLELTDHSHVLKDAKQILIVLFARKILRQHMSLHFTLQLWGDARLGPHNSLLY